MKIIKHHKFGKSIILITISTLVVIGLIFGSWGTVYAAQDSLPGDLLYAVKLTYEDIQLAITSDTQSRISLITTFADKRAAEAAILTLQGKPVPIELQGLMDGYLEELTVLTATMDDVTQQEVLEGVQRHLRPRDQDQGMTGPINSPVHDDQNPPPRDMNKNGKGQDTGDGTLEILYISTTSEISATQTITPGLYGPGPCIVPDCTTPLAEEHSPGPYWGLPPGPGSYEGYGPGSTQGQSYQQNKATNSQSDGNPQGKNSQP